MHSSVGVHPSYLLVLRLSSLGDVIHTIPAVVSLREALPGSRISWVVETPYRELVEIVAGVEAIPSQMKKWGRSPIATRGQMRKVMRAIRGADTSIDFQGLVKSAMIGTLAGAKTRIGFASIAIREKAALLFTNRKVEVDTSKHVVEQNLELAEAAGFSSPSALGGLKPVAPGNHGDWAAYPQNNALDDYAGRVVLLPGAGKRNKLWPVERFRELGLRVGDRALAVWGPGERELADAIGTKIAPPTSLRELAWILANAQLVIGGDTGPLHLAAALGSRVIGLYGPTDPARNGPYGQLDHCIDKFHSTKWMESISVEEVMDLVERVSAE